MWYFTKNGDISDGNVSISFEELVAALKGRTTGLYEIPPQKLGETLSDNDIVYINQNDGLYYKAFKNSTPTQSQNVVGAYRFINNTHNIITSGIIENFKTNLSVGKRYFLASTPGEITSSSAFNSVIIGRAVNATDMVLNISGDIDIGSFTGFDTTIVDNESKEGVGLTDPDASHAVSFNKVSYDNTLPTGIQFVDVNGSVIKLDVSTEYYGNVFNVTDGTNVYIGTFEENEDYNNPSPTTLEGAEPAPEPTPDPEPTPEPTPANNAYDTTLTGNEASEGVGLTDPNDGSDIVISFDKVTYDDSVPAEIMFLSVDGLVVKLDFQGEYSNKDIDAIHNGIRYVGVINTNEDYNNPTVLTEA